MKAVQQTKTNTKLALHARHCCHRCRLVLITEHDDRPYHTASALAVLHCLRLDSLLCCRLRARCTSGRGRLRRLRTDWLEMRYSNCTLLLAIHDPHSSHSLAPLSLPACSTPSCPIIHYLRSRQRERVKQPSWLLSSHPYPRRVLLLPLHRVSQPHCCRPLTRYWPRLRLC